MNRLDILENGLFALGQVLRLPVMLLLWVGVAATLYFVAASLVQTVQRGRERSGFNLKAWLQQGPVLSADRGRAAALPASLRTMLEAIQKDAAADALAHGAPLPRKNGAAKERQKRVAAAGERASGAWKDEAEMVLRQQYD